MGACDDRDATLDAKDVSIDRTARLARVSLSLSRAGDARATDDAPRARDAGGGSRGTPGRRRVERGRTDAARDDRRALDDRDDRVRRIAGRLARVDRSPDARRAREGSGRAIVRKP